MIAAAQSIRMQRLVTYIAAPLLLNIFFFFIYLHAGVLVFDAATRVLANTQREFELMLLRLAGFGVPIVYVLFRTRLFARSMSGHEIALLIFSAWILAGMGDIVRLLTANIISNGQAILHGVKIAAFAIAGLFGTAIIVQSLKRLLLKEQHVFFQRSLVLVLFSVAYVSVALMVLAIHLQNTGNQQGFFAAATAVVAMLVALNAYGFILFRSFFTSIGRRAFSHKQALDAQGYLSAGLSERVQSSFAELLSTIDLVSTKNANHGAIKIRLREIASSLQRQILAADRYATQVLQPPRQTIRIIDKTKPARFLIVDSNAVSRRVLSEHLLPHSDCRADAAENGKDGLHAALSLAYDAIFIALDLNDMSGLAVAQHIRDAGANVALVACADAGCGCEPDAELAGFNFYLERPFEKNEVDLQVERILTSD